MTNIVTGFSSQIEEIDVENVSTAGVLILGYAEKNGDFGMIFETFSFLLVVSEMIWDLGKSGVIVLLVVVGYKSLLKEFPVAQSTQNPIASDN